MFTSSKAFAITFSYFQNNTSSLRIPTMWSAAINAIAQQHVGCINVNVNIPCVIVYYINLCSIRNVNVNIGNVCTHDKHICMTCGFIHISSFVLKCTVYRFWWQLEIFLSSVQHFALVLPNAFQCRRVFLLLASKFLIESIFNIYILYAYCKNDCSRNA